MQRMIVFVPASIALCWYSDERSLTPPDSYINARRRSMAREDAERGREMAPSRSRGGRLRDSG